MARYRMVYGDDEQVVSETFDDVDVVREDGWTVLFRGDEAILRVRDEHVQTLEQLTRRRSRGEGGVDRDGGDDGHRLAGGVL